MKKTLQLLIGTIMLSSVSCGDPILNEVYYEFDDVVVKRIDQCNRTTLFYMQDGVPIDTVWTRYSGFTNSWFKVDLFFLSNKKVFISQGESFCRNRKESFMFEIDFMDYPSLFECKVINGVKHINRKVELYFMEDSLQKQGRVYQIALTDPDIERTTFNADNPNTKVKTLKKMPVKMMPDEIRSR